VITIHAHIHIESDKTDEILRRLSAIEAGITATTGVAHTLSRISEALMARTQEFTDLVTRLDAATNELASDLQALRDQIANGLSPADTTAVLSTLDQKIATL
jgi:hypothetical protein